MTDPLQYQLTGVLERPVEVVVVPEGARGPAGAQGTTGDTGAPGTSISVLGAWSALVAYTENQAVTDRSSTSLGYTSLWVVNAGAVPTLGVQPYLEPALWSEVGAQTATDVLGATFEVTQAGHPFTAIGQPVAFYPSTGDYQLADTRQYERLGFGLVSQVSAPDRFTVQTSGKIVGLEAAAVEGGVYTPGQILYVSTTPGFLTTTRGFASGYTSMPMVVPTEINGSAQQTGVVLGWGPSTVDRAFIGDNPPVGGSPASLWYRTNDFPGLYVLLETDHGDRWVQTNG